MFIYMYLQNNSEVDLRPLFAAARLLGSSPAGISFFGATRAFFWPPRRPACMLIWVRARTTEVTHARTVFARSCARAT